MRLSYRNLLMLNTGNRFHQILGVALVLMAFKAVPLAAQVAAQGPLTCNVLAVPAQLRAEGLTELIGDIVLTCSGGTPTPAGSSIPQANISVYLNTNVTSRILSNGGSEALLLLDEPGSPANPVQELCPNLTGCVVAGNGGSGEPFNGSTSRPNVFQGVVSANSVTFQGVPVEAPGAGSRTYRLTNIRANASGVAANAAAQIIANVSVSGSTSLPLANPQRIVGAVMPSLSYANGSITAAVCVGLSNTNEAAVLDFTETYTSAFRTRTIAGTDVGGTALQQTPGVDYNTESGFIFPGLPGSGLADFGTRFKAVFKNIPPGVSVWVSTTSVGANSTSAAQMTITETGPFFPVSSTTTLSGFNVVQLSVVNGAAAAFFEATAASPVSIDSYQFAVFFDSTGAALNASAPLATVNGGYADTPSAFPSGDPTQAQSSAFSVPRFVDKSTPSIIIAVVPCQTFLMFPFVVHGGGLDTGLAISNTSSDPVGTLAESGICTLSAFGANAPGPINTPNIAAGTVYSTLASASFPGFSGYVFAVCNFQFAHGFAFISDVGLRNLAMGYLALVLPRTAVTRPGAPTAESLAQ